MFFFLVRIRSTHGILHIKWNRSVYSFISHLNLQVLWFRLDFCHYFIVFSTGFFFIIIFNLKNQIELSFELVKCNYYLPLVLFFFLSFFLSLWVVRNLADVYSKGWKPIATTQADMIRTEVKVKLKENDILKPVDVSFKLTESFYLHLRFKFYNFFSFFENVNSFEVVSKNFWINVFVKFLLFLSAPVGWTLNIQVCVSVSVNKQWDFRSVVIVAL